MAGVTRNYPQDGDSRWDTAEVVGCAASSPCLQAVGEAEDLVLRGRHRENTGNSSCLRDTGVQGLPRDIIMTEKTARVNTQDLSLALPFRQSWEDAGKSGRMDSLTLPL